jgi:pimeloyl-ACP methyl ester carboxylesterase
MPTLEAATKRTVAVRASLLASRAETRKQPSLPKVGSNCPAVPSGSTATSLENVVLLAPAVTVLRPPAEFWARLMALGIARQRGLRAFFRWIFADKARTDPQWIDATIEQLALNMRSLQRHKLPMPRMLTDTEWGNLGTPALFLAGENEVIYSAEKAVRRLKRVAPQVTAEIIPSAGHDLTFTQPVMVNERILRFLKGERVPSVPRRAYAG